MRVAERVLQSYWVVEVTVEEPRYVRRFYFDVNETEKAWECYAAAQRAGFRATAEQVRCVRTTS